MTQQNTAQLAGEARQHHSDSRCGAKGDVGFDEAPASNAFVHTNLPVRMPNAARWGAPKPQAVKICSRKSRLLSIGQTESSGSPPDAARRSRDAGIRITPKGGNVQRRYIRKVIHHRQQGEQNEQAQYPRNRQRAGSDPCERDSGRAFRQPVCAATHAAPTRSPSHTSGGPPAESGRVRPVQQHQSDRPRRKREGEGANEGNGGSGAVCPSHL